MAPRKPTAMRLTNGRRKGENAADAVYVFDVEQEARDFAALCGGWAKKRVLCRTIRVASIQYDKHFVCLWRTPTVIHESTKHRGEDR
tara:strand:+ start:544 stop:804 length:261 start_codon:yes stop_codon:yes gene_type:complete